MRAVFFEELFFAADLRVDLAELDFLAGADFFVVLRFAVVRFAVDFFAVLRFVDDDFFEPVLFFDEDFFEPPLLFFEELFFADGTLPPSRRARERPIAIACFLLVTFLPEPPLRSFPRFISCIDSSTFSCDLRPYFAILHSSLCTKRCASGGPER